MSIGSASGPRGDGRAPDQMRALSAELGVQKWAEGSAIITVGNTVVICSASVEDRVPPHLVLIQRFLSQNRIESPL